MLEAVIALAILSLAAALVSARASVALDQIATHTAVQDFQSGLLALRAEAYAAQQARDAGAADLALGEGWSFRSPAPIHLSADGGCRGGEVELWRAGRLRARLAPAAAPCRYVRAS